MNTRDAMAGAEDELTEPERRVLLAAGTGVLVNLRAGVPELDDPGRGATWDAARTVRAELLIELLVGARTPPGTRGLRAVWLQGARITGRFDLEAATLSCPLVLEDCHVEQVINLNEARAPVVRLPGCHVPGLAADQLETRGNLELNEGFTAMGEVGLLGAHIGGTLSLSGARLTNPAGLALTADGLTVGQNLFGREGFKATGEMRLAGAHIGGTLSLSGARLTNRHGPALTADGLTVDGDLFCGEGFKATGEVQLAGAHIGGTFDLSGARLTNPHGPALTADGLIVGQNLFGRKGFNATGEMGLVGAQIGRQVDLSGARLTNPHGPALFATRLTVNLDLFCGEGFTATGEVGLAGAHIAGQLIFDGASLSNPTGPTGRALDLAGLRAGDLVLLPRQRPDGLVDLTNARVGSFIDDQATWPDRMRLRGFTYETLENDQVPVRARLRWVRRHPGHYTPQLYEQLAAAYRRDGRDEAARRVAVAKQWRRRRVLSPLGRLWNWLLYVTVGYGYRTWLAALWLGGLLIVGTKVFDRAYPTHMVAAKQPTPEFHGVMYTLDRLVPILNLGQKDAWIPQGAAALRWSWVLTGAGWVLTTAVVAGLTGVLKRD